MNTSVKIVMCCLFFGFSSCISIKRYSTTGSGNETFDFVKAHLSAHEQTVEDPDAYPPDTIVTYVPKLSDPWWLIPSSFLPKDVVAQQSNNNVSITFFDHRLYVAFRTSKTHFASKHTGLYVISTADGNSWKKEMEVFSGKDAREPFLVNINDTLRFYYFTAGTKMLKFEPGGIWMCELPKHGLWSTPKQIGPNSTVHWSIKNRRGGTYLTTYTGSHYQLEGEATVRLNFEKTNNGTDWLPVGDSATVYYGGVSEVDFEFERSGQLWAVGRLEDGDNTGFGSHIFYADSGTLGEWHHEAVADNRSFMSPRMFRHGDDFYVIARKQLGKKEFGHADRLKSMKKQRLKNWVSYSLTPKTTALYKLNKSTKQLEWVVDMLGAGDTAFSSIVRLNANQFLVANYTSPPHKRKFSWLRGQLGKTLIYLQVISFVH